MLKKYAEDITIKHPIKGEVDALGVPAISWDLEDVTDVLVQSVSSSDLSAEMPDGTKVQARFYFPKSYTKSLKGCIICVRNHEFRVIGDPMPQVETCPTSWGMCAEAVYVDE